MANEDILVTLKADMGELKNSFNQLNNNLSESTNKTSGLGKLLGSFGKVAGIAVIAKQVWDLGVEVVNTGKEFEASMSKVQAISGATGAELSKLEGLARDLGATTVFSAKEASEGMQYLAMAGWDAQQIMSGLPAILDLAVASGEDLATVSDICSDAMTAFGLSADKATRFADVLAVTSSSANTNVSMLGESFKYVAPVAGALGYTVEDTAVALGLMANAGIKSSQSGTALRASLNRLVSPTDDASAAMKKYGISITNQDGSMKSLGQVMDTLRNKLGGLDEATQAQVASTIFGTEAMSGMLAIINTSQADYDKLTASIKNADGSAKSMAETMSNNLEGSLKSMNSAWEEMKLKMYDAIQPALKGTVDVITNCMQAINGLNATGLEFSSGFGDNVSDATTKALTPFQELNRGIIGVGEQLRMLGSEVTPEFADTMNGHLNSWKEQSTALLDEKYKEDLQILQNYFASNEAMTEEEQSAMLQNLNDHYNNAKTMTDENLAKIQEIMQRASEEKRSLTAEENAEIERLQQENYNKLVQMASQSTDEEMAILESLASEKDKITADSATKVWQRAKEQKDNVIREATALRDEEIRQAYRLKQAGAISEEEYNKMTETAKNKFSETEKKAEESFNGIVDSVETSVKALEKEFDRGTGEVLGGWKAFCNKTKNWWATFKAKFTVEESRTTSSSGGGSGKASTSSVSYGMRASSVGARGVAVEGVAVASGLRSAMGLDTQEQLLRQVLETNSGAGVHIENFNNNREQDIAQLAKELEYYRKRYSFGIGGKK